MAKPWVEKTPERYDVKRTVEDEPYFVHQVASVPKNATVGRYSYIHGNVRVTGSEPMRIGNFCSIASGVTIHCGDEHDYNRISTYPFQTILGLKVSYEEVLGKGVNIGNDVWIGEGARILSGSTVGNGVVLGAGCLVKGNIQPYGIYGGNPAKLIRMRFSPHKIARLEEICWWNWPIEKITYNVGFLSANLNELSDHDFDELIKNIV
jgi:acetyltransferase-like isoleucine patch superfamily enzyme